MKLCIRCGHAGYHTPAQCLNNTLQDAIDASDAYSEVLRELIRSLDQIAEVSDTLAKITERENGKTKSRNTP